MTTSFPLRFKDPQTKEMLRVVATELGIPMTEIAEEAIRHELVLLGRDLDRQLTEVVEALRSYDPERDIDHYLDQIEAGEAQDDPIQARQIPSNPAKRATSIQAPRATQPKRKKKTSAVDLTAELAAFSRR